MYVRCSTSDDIFTRTFSVTAIIAKSHKGCSKTYTSGNIQNSGGFTNNPMSNLALTK